MGRSTSNSVLFSHSTSLSGVRLLVLDVDGILTDGHFWQDSKGKNRRYFSVRDNMGLRALKRAGVEIAVVTNASGDEVSQHIRSLGVDHFVDKCADKEKASFEIAKQLNLSFSHVAFAVGANTGWDWIATTSAVQIAPNREGGDGAVLEICNWILEAINEGKNSINEDEHRIAAV